MWLEKFVWILAKKLCCHHCSAENQLREAKQSISGVNWHCTNGSETCQQYELNTPALQLFKLSLKLLFHITAINIVLSRNTLQKPASIWVKTTLRLETFGFSKSTFYFDTQVSMFGILLYQGALQGELLKLRNTYPISRRIYSDVTRNMLRHENEALNLHSSSYMERDTWNHHVNVPVRLVSSSLITRRLTL